MYRSLVFSKSLRDPTGTLESTADTVLQERTNLNYHYKGSISERQIDGKGKLITSGQE